MNPSANTRYCLSNRLLRGSVHLPVLAAGDRVELAGDDGNPNTEPDPNWLPLSVKTAPDPSYPGAHSAISFAGAQVLKSNLGDRFTFDVTSESLKGVTRHFTSFSAAAQEAGLSRIYALASGVRTGASNLAAFSNTFLGHVGDSGRNQFYGPHCTNADGVLMIHINERFRMQLRSEFFNLLNHPQFQQPGNVVE